MLYGEYLPLKAEAINNILEWTKEKATFFFLSDIHWGANCKHSSHIIDLLTGLTPVDKAFVGGDIITHSDPDKEAMMMLGMNFRTAFSSIRNFYCLRGNHDDNSYEQTNLKAILSSNDMYEFLYNSSTYKERHFSNWDYYFDCDKEKSRYICIDTSQKEKNEEQESFLCETFMNTPDGYHIILIAHIWLEWEPGRRIYLPNEQTKSLFEIFQKYNQRKKYKKYDFVNCRGRIELMLGGHIHNDYVTFDYAGGIPLVLSDSDAMYKSCNRRFPPQKGFPTEQCLNCVVMDYTNRKSYFIRIGRGEDFMIDCVTSRVSPLECDEISL